MGGPLPLAVGVVFYFASDTFTGPDPAAQMSLIDCLLVINGQTLNMHTLDGPAQMWKAIFSGEALISHTEPCVWDSWRGEERKEGWREKNKKLEDEKEGEGMQGNDRQRET